MVCPLYMIAQSRNHPTHHRSSGRKRRSANLDRGSDGDHLAVGPTWPGGEHGDDEEGQGDPGRTAPARRHCGTGTNPSGCTANQKARPGPADRRNSRLHRTRVPSPSRRPSAGLVGIATPRVRARRPRRPAVRASPDRAARRGHRATTADAPWRTPRLSAASPGG